MPCIWKVEIENFSKNERDIFFQNRLKKKRKVRYKQIETERVIITLSV